MKARSFFRSTEGVTAVEFALIAPALLLLIMGVVEFSLVMFVSSVMEGATSNMARYGKTGFVASGSTRQQQILAAVAQRTNGILDPNKITVVSTVYPSFDSINQPEPYIDANHNGHYDLGETYTDSNGNGQWDADMGTAGLGNANDIVVYTVTYPWHINTPIIAAFLGSTFTITARSVVKNEPYNN